MEPSVPRLPVFRAYPELQGMAVEMGTVAYGRNNMDPLEQYLVAALARLRRPRRIFEIGTFDGATTLLLARNAPEAEVLTLDLPKADAERATVDAEVANNRGPGVGRLFGGGGDDGEGSRRGESDGSGGDEVEERITQLRGDSRTFDFTPWHGTVDLVVVDAGHEYENVVSDTGAALALLRSPAESMIVWDDFTDYWPGVVAAVSEAPVPTFVLGTTDLAVFDPRVDVAAVTAHLTDSSDDG